MTFSARSALRDHSATAPGLVARSVAYRTPPQKGPYLPMVQAVHCSWAQYHKGPTSLSFYCKRGKRALIPGRVL